jgi:DNA-binding NarL/FixJ family response regulator
MMRIIVENDDAEQMAELIVEILKWDGMAVRSYNTREPASTSGRNRKRSSNSLKYPKTRRNWSEEDSTKLLDMFTEGKSDRQIAEALGRTRSAVSSQLWKLQNPDKAERGKS